MEDFPLKYTKTTKSNSPMVFKILKTLHSPFGPETEYEGTPSFMINGPIGIESSHTCIGETGEKIGKTTFGDGIIRNKTENHPVETNINNGRWELSEHKRFVEGLSKFNLNWKKIRNYVETRSITQIRSHAQKYFNKLERETNKKSTLNTEAVPPSKSRSDKFPPILMKRKILKRYGPGTTHIKFFSEYKEESLKDESFSSIDKVQPNITLNEFPDESHRNDDWELNI